MGSEHWAKGFGNRESGFESGVPAVQGSRFRDLQPSSFHRMETPPQTTQELRNSRSTHLEQFPIKATGSGRSPANRELASLIPSAMGDAQENPNPFQNPENLVQNPIEIQTVTQALVYLRGCTTVTDAYHSLAKQVGAFAVSHLPIHKILPLLAHYVNQMSNVPDGEGRGMTFSIPQRNVFFDEGMQRMVLGPLRPIFLQRKKPKWTRLFRAFTILLNILQEHPPRKTLPTTFVNALEQASTFLQELMDMWVASPPMITPSYDYKGTNYDCPREWYGRVIPQDITRVSNVNSSTSQVIILVEKYTVFHQFCQDRFFDKIPCILITGCGQPDVSIRMFLRLLCLETNLPVLGLMDCDPYGLKILSVYKYGSIDMAYDSNHLTTPGILWLGLRPSDLETYHLPQDMYTNLVDDDRTTASSLL
ncbi:hypothetical protein RHSIM_RhsimUnG0086200 [Rhododendron simsii]|uniref:Topoisomerase 6 subunit A/Spo11 TOPRIM domain-containing protein n=1 Tax=Rhododendron simsii TaxID=118357 RepID=A0A834FVN5_RHOSS|nr:hypothetical protein RHSIM_RhsimUnG0086200 [Rhododendron simsii]